MKALLFAEGGPKVGLGHLRRCAALADAMSKKNWHAAFLASDPDSRAWLSAKDYPVGKAKPPASGRLPEADYSCDVFLVDSYALSNAEIAEKIRPHARLIAAFDDLFHRHASADVIVSSGILSPQAPWPRRKGLTHLLGPKYHPLPAEYLPLSRRSIEPALSNVLITMGGSGTSTALAPVIRILRRMLPKASLHCVLGPFANGQDSCGQFPEVRWHRNPPSFKDLLLDCDLAVTAAGQTLFELAATGTPGIAVGVSENQRDNLKGMEQAGIVLSAGYAGDPGFEAALEKCLTRAQDLKLRQKLSKNGQALIDGCGAERIVDAISKLLMKQKPVRA